MTIEEITQGLTEAQRLAVLAIDPKHGTWIDDIPGSTPLYPAYEACLASRCWLPGYKYKLTSLGYAVRTHLERKGHED
jgi:hypothetical protein